MKGMSDVSVVLLECDDYNFVARGEEFPMKMIDGDRELINKVLLSATVSCSWTWDMNAWPLPLVPQVVMGLEGRSLIMLFEHKSFKVCGLSAIPALDNVFISAET